MQIFVTGLCTLHWGRLEFGNIGNYYIIEPLFQQLRRVFPEAALVTTFQMTETFAKKHQIQILPMELFYGWREDDIKQARMEYELAYGSGSDQPESDTDFMACVRNSDLVVDVSGDMWGDNAEHVGKGRFYVDLLKLRTAQLMGCKTVLFAGTPGPFSDQEIIPFAKEVYANFDLVINREPTSTHNLSKWNFTSRNVKDFACPAFLYTPVLSEKENLNIRSYVAQIKNGQLIAGFSIGGFNLPVGPYDRWPREDSQYDVFANAIEYLINELGVKVLLISHTNGFERSPEFQLINGRDYPILKQLREVVLKRGFVQNEDDLVLTETPRLPYLQKALIGQMDLFVAGRVHASVAAISQYVPTVFIEYEKRFIPSTKMYGFSSLAGVEELVCKPGNQGQVLEKIKYCYENREEIKSRLEKRIPEVRELARNAFDALKQFEGSAKEKL